MTVEFTTRGLDQLSAFFREMPELASRAAVFAVNDGSTFARRLSSKEIRDQVNLSAGYLLDNGRLTITKKARGDDIEAVVTGRNRPTSLARFASTAPTFGRKRRGIRVKVARGGGGATMKRAFFVKLRSGKNLDNYNIGLAVRTADGKPPKNTRGATPIFDGAYLLYGPSVGQVFYDVASHIAEPVGDQVASNFVRHFARLNK